MRGPLLRETISQLFQDPIRFKASFGKQKMKMNSSPKAAWTRVNGVPHLIPSSNKSAQVTVEPKGSGWDHDPRQGRGAGHAHHAHSDFSLTLFRKRNRRLGACLVAQTVKNPPAVQETRIQSLGQEDPLEEGMATHSSTLAWRNPWTVEPGGLQSMESQSRP